MKKPHVLLAIALLISAATVSLISASNAQSGKVTLTLGTWANSPETNKAYTSWVKSFEKTNPNVTIDVEILPWGQYWDKVRTTTSAGNAYDLMQVCSCVAGPYYENAQFVDLKTFSNYAQVAAPLNKTGLNLFTWGGKVYGLPIGLAVRSIAYNKAMFREAGVELLSATRPMNFTTLLSIAKKLTKTSGGKTTQYALVASAYDNLFGWANLVQMEGGQVLDRAVNPSAVEVNTPAGIRGLSNYLTLYKEGVTPPVDEVKTGVFSREYGTIQTGKVAMTGVGPWNFADIANDIKAGKFEVGLAPQIRVKSAVQISTANGLNIYANSKHPKEAWEFIQWATRQDNQLAFGKFSDVPAHTGAARQLRNVISPAGFGAVVVANLPSFQSYPMSNKPELIDTLDAIVNDMTRGKYTPAQAAAELERQGNAVLSAK
jgi:multiple sugar transport system substrate-binding protein